MARQRSAVVIGGGIVGLASAYQLTQRYPGTRVTVLEKEAAVAHHQTGHNSGVIHSGIYYKPGSLKARNCRDGKRAMEVFCERESIPYELCGKVIVATAEKELAGLAKLYEKGQANGVVCEMIGPERLRELEPHVNGIKAIHVKEAGIAAYVQVCKRLAELVVREGGSVITSARATAIRHQPNSIVVESTAGPHEADYLINCAGLQSDRVTALSGARPPAKIVPFRGEYFELAPDAARLCRNLIYPVPDPNFPFLGVHYTRMIAGGVECGPNAVLALAREGYTWSKINLVDLAEVLTYPGFLRMMAKHWAMASYEVWRSLNKSAFTRALQRLIPEIKEADLHPAPAGIRAQALTNEGTLVDDFLLQESPRIVNVCNAPSPAATASLAIGNHIVDTLARQF
ncbi:MAG: lhgO [Bryobacterales bacterium]|nr:lhgO [Bryobacterales bacterium]